MIDFKQITLADKTAIDTVFEGNAYRACDFSFTNLYSWNARFKSVFAIIDHTIFLRFQDLDGQLYYMMPIGTMQLSEAISLIKLDAQENCIPFQMKGVSLDMWNAIEEEIPGELQRIPDRNNNEYIYLSEKLIKLSGKKLQSKRNHINRFKVENPDWEYLTLKSKTDFEECAKMLDEWEDVNNLKNDFTQRFDYIATKIMLDKFDILQLCGGAIRVNGKIVAFSIGEPLTSDTFVVHVEKAFGDMNGAYTTINQQFVEHEAAAFTYINREEDMGIPNLRKAKMSYYPDLLLEESILIPKV